MISLGLSQAKMVLYGTIVIAFLTLGGWWYIRGLQIDNLRQEVVTLEQAVESANARIRQAENAARIASERLDAVRLEERQVNEAVSSARRMEGSNAPISPSVRDAVNSIERMRRTTGSPSGASDTR